MKSFLGFYKCFSFLAPIVFLGKLIREKNSTRRISLFKRAKDYLNFWRKPKIQEFHYSLNEILERSWNSWDGYDYGEGYFYQSFDLVEISGLRDSRARLQEMNLVDLLKNKKILEIGCNSGFLSLSLCPFVSHITALDINPYLISIGNLTKKFLAFENVTFFASSFEEFNSTETFDAVLSFAKGPSKNKVVIWSGTLANRTLLWRRHD